MLCFPGVQTETDQFCFSLVNGIMAENMEIYTCYTHNPLTFKVPAKTAAHVSREYCSLSFRENET